jgi:hypothetical protein
MKLKIIKEVINMREIPMIFISVPQSKYDKVTRKREYEMIRFVGDSLGGSGIKVITTGNVTNLPECDSAYFHEKYKNTAEYKCHMTLCERYNVTPIVIAKGK